MTNDALDAWWRAANYLSAAQIYLKSNPLLREPLTAEDIKPRLLGHWGTAPGLNLVYAHLNRIITERRQEMLYVCGPGHGGAAMVANAWLDGTYSELMPEVSFDEKGLAQLVRQFSFPGGIPSHAAPETPGSINEGGELGYSLMHAYGAALDNPSLVVACVIGDGEAETGPLAASWRAHMFLNPVRDGFVLPILHLNGYKIASPTPLARIPDGYLHAFLRGNGYEPFTVEAGLDDTSVIHPMMAETMDAAFDRLAEIRAAGIDGASSMPRWPVIVMRTPKGWTGPRFVDGKQVEGTEASHQIPLKEVREDPEHLHQLEGWLQSYRPAELFTADGAPAPILDEIRPDPGLSMSASPHAQGGIASPLTLPELAPYEAPAVTDGGTASDPDATAPATTVFAGWLTELMRANPDAFRLFGPDEVESNRLGQVFEVTDRTWNLDEHDTDTNLGHDGAVIEALSEHLMQGMLEGYLLSGRHGLITSYEAFIHIVDSMFNQHAKWLEASRDVEWRKPVASLNYLLSSHVWRQDHNGFSHQDPGFLNLVVNKGPDIVRVYLPPDANTLLSTMRHVFDTHDRINVVVAGKNDQPSWLSLDDAEKHAAAGLGVWDWAGNEGSGIPGSDSDSTDAAAAADPHVVIACAGDVPTIEAIAAAQLIRETLPDLRVRVVNVVDLMRLASHEQHPHGLSDADFDAVFTRECPVIFAFHGYPSLIHQLTYKRTNHAGFHVHGFAERGTTTTPFDMVHLNDLDRYALAIDAVTRAGLDETGAGSTAIHDWWTARDDARAYAYEHGEDPPWITDWEFRFPQ
ncbi:phosphoketolase family protein [Paramicrobacterium sp. CJ85]|uniref:phosphoketolase family protein n=1 Tax=Paramicrobacterium sp. CJ85 TaxID=3445355 RepID=UPI003F60032B